MRACAMWGLTSMKWWNVAAEEGEKKRWRKRRRKALPYRLCYTLSIMSFFVCKRTSAQLCILTALCKWLAGGNDFREKVILCPLVHINDSFIHFQVYKSRWGKEGVKVGGCDTGRGVGEKHLQLTEKTDISKNHLKLPIRGGPTVPSAWPPCWTVARRAPWQLHFNDSGRKEHARRLSMSDCIMGQLLSKVCHLQCESSSNDFKVCN